MKNSAWYFKRWQKKMNALPPPGSPDQGWAAMERLLNAHLPVSASSDKTDNSRAGSSSGQKVRQFLAYVAPVAIIVTVFTLYKTENMTEKKQKTTDKAMHITDTSGFAQRDTLVTIVPDTTVISFKPALRTDNVPLLPPAGSLKVDSLPVHRDTMPPVWSEIIRYDLPDRLKTIPSSIILHHGDHHITSSIPIAIMEPLSVKPARLKNTDAWFNRNTAVRYGIVLGGAYTNSGYNAYMGISAGKALDSRWDAAAALRLHTARSIQAAYTHPSYFRPDSIAPFHLVHERKIHIAEIEFALKYRITPDFYVKTGPVAGFRWRQSGIQNRIGKVPDLRDTLFHEKQIKQALNRTRFTPAIHLDYMAGAGFQWRCFQLEAQYQHHLKPFEISTDLGSSRFYRHTFLFGIGYSLSKPKRRP